VKRGDRLFLFWWLYPRGRRHRYVCPLAMTLSILWERLHGKDAHWTWCTYSDGSACAMAVIGNGEISCRLPRKWIIRECNFWNSHVGLWIRSRGRGRKETP